MVNDHRATKVCRTTTNRHQYHTQHQIKPTKDAKNAFIIFHQNICGLPNKHEELLHSLTEHPPQIICLTEHHLHDEELESMTFSKCTLGTKFYRKIHKGGWGCMYTHKRQSTLCKY